MPFMTPGVPPGMMPPNAQMFTPRGPPPDFRGRGGYGGPPPVRGVFTPGGFRGRLITEHFKNYKLKFVNTKRN